MWQVCMETSGDGGNKSALVVCTFSILSTCLLVLMVIEETKSSN